MNIDAKLKSILQAVMRAVDSEREKDAVHLFMQAVAHDPTLNQVDLPPVLTKVLGKSRTEFLIQAFAELPCMGCSRGIWLCDDCHGSGISGETSVCEKCTGLGAGNCGFCAGSGWITYNYMPPGLRPAVVLSRTRLVIAEARTLLELPLPEADLAGRATVRKKLVKQILAHNRLLGALGNAMEVVKRQSESTGAAKAMLEQVRAVGAKAVPRLEKRVRSLLGQLAVLAKLEADQATDVDEKKLAVRRAKYYATIMKSSDFKGTSLFHLHLKRPPKTVPRT